MVKLFTKQSTATPHKTTNIRTTVFALLGWAALGVHWYSRRDLDFASSSQPQEVNKAVDTTTPPTKSFAAEPNRQASTGKNRRKFLSYTSSAWEQLWLDNVQQWTDQQQICQILLTDEKNRGYMHDFLQLICTTKLKAPYEHWCMMDDEYKPLFYDTKNKTVGGYAIYFQQESPFKDMDLATLVDDSPQPVWPGTAHEHIMSKFVFLDEETGEEYVEYIEPLVSHLRFPLAICLPTRIWPIPYALFRGYVIPPPQQPRGRKAVYYDAGASSWSKGGGGPSLKFFVNMWKRHGIEFQDIFAYEMTTSPDEFYEDVPPEYKSRTHYRQCAVSSSPDGETDDNPFIPHQIEKYVKDQTALGNELYVFFKLDIDSAKVEQGSVDYLLEKAPGLIHEFAWEHHVRGNYLMRKAWAGPGKAPLSLRQSYDLFLRMRQVGIRAHSWV